MSVSSASSGVGGSRVRSPSCSLLGATTNPHLQMEREVLPLDYQAFNRFHHGGKVRTQNIEALHNCLAEGQRHGQPMAALQALLAKLSAHEAASQAVPQG